MAHLTIYLSDELKKKVQDRAKAEGKSVSAWVTQVLEEHMQKEEPTRKFEWPEGYFELFGSLADVDDFEAPPDVPPGG